MFWSTFRSSRRKVKIEFTTRPSRFGPRQRFMIYFRALRANNEGNWGQKDTNPIMQRAERSRFSHIAGWIVAFRLFSSRGQANILLTVISFELVCVCKLPAFWMILSCFFCFWLCMFNQLIGLILVQAMVVLTPCTRADNRAWTLWMRSDWR